MRKGYIDSNYRVKDTLKVAPSNKFLQIDDYRMTDRFISYLMTTPKYPIGSIETADVVSDLNFDFGTLNKENEFDNNTYDYCQTGVRFFAAKEGASRLHLLAMFTNNSRMGISYSAYYLPRGRFDKICLVARFCHHRGANEHRNRLDDTVIPDNSFHIHKMSEAFYDLCVKECKTKEALVMRLQSPDAILVPGIDCKNIKQLTEYARNQLNVTDNFISIETLFNNQIAGQIRDAIMSYEEGM
jgi:hypothetical protein